MNVTGVNLGDAPLSTAVCVGPVTFAEIALPVAVIDPLPASRFGITNTLVSAGIEARGLEGIGEWNAASFGGAVVAADDLDTLLDLTDRLAAGGSFLTVVLSPEIQPTAVRKLLERGCDALLERSVEPQLIVRAIAASHRGYVMIPNRSLMEVTKYVHPALELNEEQVEWLQKLATGESVSELARRAGYSTRAMHRRLHEMYQRMQVKGIMEALILAARSGLV